MSPDAWITLAVVVLIIGFLAANLAPPDAVFLGGLTLLLALGVFGDDLSAAFSGFSNPAPIMIGALFVVAAGLQETGALQGIARFFLGSPRSLRLAQLRMMTPVLTASAFLNNTPVVAMFLPLVSEWTKRTGLSPSKLLMPLSYAAIFGGLCTLVGTSTNLVVYGLVAEFAPEHEIGFFDVSWVGVPAGILGLGYVLAWSRNLPDRKGDQPVVEDPKEYTVEMMVMENSPIVGLTIEGAGLRHLPGLYLAEIQRDETVLPAVSPSERLEAGDRLLFVGIVESIVDLQKIRGLVPMPEQVFKLSSPRSSRVLVEAVVSNTSPLIGRTVREGRFRTIYNAAILSVHRGADRVRKKIGDIVLQPGDTLLLETHQEFVTQNRSSQSFFLVSPVANSAPPRFERAPYALGIVVLFVLALVFGWFRPVVAALLAAALMVGLRCLPPNSARRSIDWSTLIVIASAFGVGKALAVSGAAGSIAGGLLTVLAGTSPIWFLLALYVITNLSTEFMTNNAAAVLVFPLAVEVAHALDVSIAPFALAIMVAASAGFATPIGYQTNLMVWGPGGYRFTDFTRFGLPLNLIYLAVTMLVVPLVFPF